MLWIAAAHGTATPPRVTALISHNPNPGIE